MIAFAARRDDGCGFKSVKISSSNGKFTITTEFRNLPADPLEYTLTLFSCNRDGEELTRKDFSFIPSEKAFSFALPAKYWNGQQLIGLILRDPSGCVTDFGAESSQCLPPARSHKLVSDKNHYREGEKAKFTLTSTVEKNSPAEVRWKLYDAFGRVVKSGKVPAKAVNVIETAISSSLKSRNYTFSAEMFLRDQLVGRRSLKITAAPAEEKLVWDDFEAGIWITPYSYEAARTAFHDFYAGALRKMHITTILGNSRQADLDFALANNFNPTIYQGAGTRPAGISPEYRKSGDKMLLVRNPCLSSPEFRETMRKRFRDLGEKYKDYGIRFYWFGDELSLTGYWSSAIDFCFSSSCLKGFRQFLKDKYGSVEKAAAQWGKNYTSFDQFVPETREEAKSRGDGNYSAWADHLEYMDSLLYDYITWFTEQGLRKGDPTARGFISGPQGPSAYGGNDWSIQSSAYTGLMSYNLGGLPDILHSFNPETVDLPWVLGYANYGGKVCYELWKSLQYRAKGVMGFSMASMIRPDGTLSRSGRAAAEYLPEIQAGTGKLVISCLRPAEPEILILYSQSSIRAAYISGRANEHEELRVKYITLCRNFGIPFRFVTEKEILSGICTRLKPRLLILPDSDALSDACVKTLGDFLSRGGHLLAEGNLGTMDASCKKRAAPISLPGIIRISGIRSGYNRAFSKTATEREVSEKEYLAAERNSFSRILRECGITPPVIWRTQDGEAFCDAETVVMNDSRNNQYLLSICREKNPIAVRAEWPRPWFVRNLRGNECVMKEDNPLFFLLLGQEEKPDLRLSVKAGGSRELTLGMDSGVRRDTVFHVTVRNPAGKMLRHYNANLAGGKGKAEYRLNFAENDLPGIWTITVTDITACQKKALTYLLK